MKRWKITNKIKPFSLYTRQLFSWNHEYKVSLFQSKGKTDRIRHITKKIRLENNKNWKIQLFFEAYSLLLSSCSCIFLIYYFMCSNWCVALWIQYMNWWYFWTLLQKAAWLFSRRDKCKGFFEMGIRIKESLKFASDQPGNSLVIDFVLQTQFIDFLLTLELMNFMVTSYFIPINRTWFRQLILNILSKLVHVIVLGNVIEKSVVLDRGELQIYLRRRFTISY